jgi:hypothetical protein
MGDGRSQKGKSMLLSAIQIGLLAYAGLAALIYFKQDALVFQAAMERGYEATPARIGLRFDALTLATEDGETLDAWHVPARPAQAHTAWSWSSTAMPATSDIALTICACSTISVMPA